MRYSSKITIPILCPIRFEAVELLTELTFYSKAFTYLQKWTTSTDIHVQIFHDDTGKTLTFRQKYITGEVQDATFIETVMSTGVYCYDVILTPLQEGVCYFQILEGSTVLADSKLGTDDKGNEFGFHKVGTFNNVVLITYWNSSNDFNARFDSYQASNTFTFCVEGGFIPSRFEPKNDMKIFTDSVMQDTLGYSNPSSVRTLYLGDAHGIPPYLVEKLNFIFSCDVTLIRNVQWQATEAISVEDAPHSRQYVTVPMKRKSNIYTENYGGVIYITDKYGNVITGFSVTDDKSLVL